MARALVNKLLFGKVYFPRYNKEYVSGLLNDGTSIRDTYTTTYSTLVRIQGKNGKWYIAPISKQYMNLEISKEEFAFTLFMNEAYNMLVNGLVPDNIESLMTVEGYPLFRLDELQISEQERMKNI